MRCTRAVHISALLLPPLIFTGLALALYAWKCFMLVLFQNKIIYNPGLPPFARFEKIEEYAGTCGGVRWSEDSIRAEDGTRLAIALTSLYVSPGKPGDRLAAAPYAAHIYVLYLQGNASSTPPRLPDLSWVLRAVVDNKAHQLPTLPLTFVCLSYRGYWTSSGRPSEKGIRRDAEAAQQWLARQHSERYDCRDGPDRPDRPMPILILWGQSIGCGVATNLAASTRLSPELPVRAMILETPFLSVRAMLETLYPEKWLPYRHLWPFLRNHLDSWANLGVVADMVQRGGKNPPNVFLLQAERDELVPAGHAEGLQQRCLELGLPVELVKASNAYHNEAIARAAGKQAIAHAILKTAEQCLKSRLVGGEEKITGDATPGID